MLPLKSDLRLSHWAKVHKFNSDVPEEIRWAIYLKALGIKYTFYGRKDLEKEDSYLYTEKFLTVLGFHIQFMNLYLVIEPENSQLDSADLRTMRDCSEAGENILVLCKGNPRFDSFKAFLGNGTETRVWLFPLMFQDFLGILKEKMFDFSENEPYIGALFLANSYS